jgi:hypothetical protein
MHTKLTTMHDCRATSKAQTATPLSNGHVGQVVCNRNKGELNFESGQSRNEVEEQFYLRCFLVVVGLNLFNLPSCKTRTLTEFTYVDPSLVWSAYVRYHKYLEREEHTMRVLDGREFVSGST